MGYSNLETVWVKFTIEEIIKLYINFRTKKLLVNRDLLTVFYIYYFTSLFEVTFHKLRSYQR